MNRQKYTGALRVFSLAEACPIHRKDVLIRTILVTDFRSSFSLVGGSCNESFDFDRDRGHK